MANARAQTEGEIGMIGDNLLGHDYTPWEGKDQPTDKDLQYVRQNPDDSTVNSFVQKFGQGALPWSL